MPAVINGAGSVFGTDIAREWLRLLEALERPASMTRAHSAALTRSSAGAPSDVAAAGRGRAWEEVHRRLHDWARVLRNRGVAALAETITRDRGAARAAAGATPDGERRLTDLRHVGQLLHGAATDASSSASPRSPRGFAGGSSKPGATSPTRTAAGGLSQTPTRFRC